MVEEKCSQMIDVFASPLEVVTLLVLGVSDRSQGMSFPVDLMLFSKMLDGTTKLQMVVLSNLGIFGSSCLIWVFCPCPLQVQWLMTNSKTSLNPLQVVCAAISPCCSHQALASHRQPHGLCKVATKGGHHTVLLSKIWMPGFFWMHLLRYMEGMLSCRAWRMPKQ